MTVRRIESIKGGTVSFSDVDYDDRGERSRYSSLSIDDYRECIANALYWGHGCYAESLKYAPDGIYKSCDCCGAIYINKENSEGGGNCENHASFGYFDFHSFAKVDDKLLGYCANEKCAGHKVLGNVDVVPVKNKDENDRFAILCLSCKYTEYVPRR